MNIIQPPAYVGFFYVTGHPLGRGTAHRVDEGHLPSDEAADRPGTGEVAVPIALLTAE